MDHSKNDLKDFTLKNAAIFVAGVVLLMGTVCFCNHDSDDRTEEDNPLLGYYFDYTTNSYEERPYKMYGIDTTSRAFKEHADAFNKCKQSCYAQKLVPQDYFHDYYGRCKCLTVKDKIAHQQKARSR